MRLGGGCGCGVASSRVIEVFRLLASGSQGAWDLPKIDREGRVQGESSLSRHVGEHSPGQVCSSRESALHVLGMAEREHPVVGRVVLDFTGVERLGREAALAFIAFREPGLVVAERMCPAVRAVWERSWREVLA